ncbi:MAG: archaeosortase/exosortase family protein [Cyanobium sp.]
MMFPQTLLSPSILISRWRMLDEKGLWLLLAALLGIYLFLLSLLTQLPDEAINVALVMGGALVVFEGFPDRWQPRPGRVGRWVGVALLVLVLARGQRILAFDFASSLLPLLAGLGLVLLAAPWNQGQIFLRSLLVLGFLPVMRWLGWVTPLEPLSVATAWITHQFLWFSGFPSKLAGIFINLPTAGVKVSDACAGLNMLLQLFVVAVIFAMAFPMRHRWQNGLMLVIAPLIALLTNAGRIMALALINDSTLANKKWWFDFFHEQWGGLVFAGIAMQLFVWLYVYWLARQVAALGTR